MKLASCGSLLLLFLTVHTVTSTLSKSDRGKKKKKDEEVHGALALALNRFKPPVNATDRTKAITQDILCYGHKSSTGTVRRIFHQNFLDIIRCPVNFSCYLKFHGAWPAFAHIGRAPHDFCLIFISYDSNGARPGTAGHRMMSDKRQELSKIA